MVITSKEIVVPSLVNYVGYLQSTGTQYIDTGFVPNQDTRVVIDFAYLDENGNAFFGSRVASGNRAFTFWPASAGNWRDNYGSSNATYGIADSERHTLDKNKNTTHFDDEVLGTYSAETFTCPGNLYLFAINQNGTVNYHSKVRIYSCQIYDNGALIRDFRPCYDPDGVLCLYEKVEKKYYYNAGSGEFTHGEGDTSSVFNFTINSVSYLADNGMIWGEWVQSSYNTDGFMVDLDGTIWSASSKFVHLSGSSAYVYDTDLIIENASYKYG